MRAALAPCMTSNSDEWTTPRDFFDRLDAEFHFTLDAAATHENALCRDYMTATGRWRADTGGGIAGKFEPSDEGALSVSWEGRSVWLNCPYSRGIQSAFIRKAAAEAALGCTVVVLLPARTDTRTFHDVIMPNAAEIRLVRGRLRFGGATTGAPFPSMVVVFRPTREGVAPRLTTMNARPT